jgi:hypothetical protein
MTDCMDCGVRCGGVDAAQNPSLCYYRHLTYGWVLCKTCNKIRIQQNEYKCNYAPLFLIVFGFSLTLVAVGLTIINKSR